MFSTLRVSQLRLLGCQVCLKQVNALVVAPVGAVASGLVELVEDHAFTSTERSLPSMDQTVTEQVSPVCASLGHAFQRTTPS